MLEAQFSRNIIFASGYITCGVEKVKQEVDSPNFIRPQAPTSTTIKP